MKSTWVKRAILAVLFIMATVSVVQGINNGMDHPGDFMWKAFRNVMYQRTWGETYIPFTFWMFFPLGLFPETFARTLWIFINIVCTAVSAWALRKTFFRSMEQMEYVALMLIMISGAAWRTNLSNGQYGLPAIAFFFLSVYFTERGKDLPAGLFLALSIYKYQLIVPVAVYYFFKKQYKTIAVAAGVLLLSLIATSIWLGSIYDATIKPLLISQNIGLGDAGDVDIESLLGLGDYIIPLFLIGIALLMMFAYLLRWRKDDLLFVSIGFFVAWALAYNRVYNFFPLIIPLGYSYAKMKSEDLVRIRFYRIEFIGLFLLTASFFWLRTISLEVGVTAERILFYPVFALLLIDLFYYHRLQVSR